MGVWCWQVSTSHVLLQLILIKDFDRSLVTNRRQTMRIRIPTVMTVVAVVFLVDVSGAPSGGSMYPSGGSRYLSGGSRYPSGGSRYPSGGSMYPSGGSRYPSSGSKAMWPKRAYDYSRVSDGRNLQCARRPFVAFPRPRSDASRCSVGM